jgi:hypothetical protein
LNKRSTCAGTEQLSRPWERNSKATGEGTVTYCKINILKDVWVSIGLAVTDRHWQWWTQLLKKVTMIRYSLLGPEKIMVIPLLVNRA